MLKKNIKVLLIAFALMLFAVSCELSKNVAKSSKVILITVSNDYYDLKSNSSLLTECNNDTIALAEQFKLMMGNNLEILSFYSQFGKEYIQEGFDSSLFSKKGIRISSSQTVTPIDESRVDDWTKRKGGFLVKDILVRNDKLDLQFRIGDKCNATDSTKWSNDDNWGAELDLYNPDGNPDALESLSLRYCGNYWLFRCIDNQYRPVFYNKDGYDKYYRTNGQDDSGVVKIVPGQLYPLEFTVYVEGTVAGEGTEINPIKDESYYETNQGKRGKGVELLDSYYPSTASEVNNANSDRFVYYKIDDSLEHKWLWKSYETQAPDDTVFLQDKVKSFLSSKGINKDDVIIFYYSGHGADGVKQNKIEYWNDNGSFQFYNKEHSGIVGAYASDVLSLFDEYDCYKVFIADSCFSGTLVDKAGSSLSSVQQYNSAWMYAKNDIDMFYYQYYSGKDDIFSPLFSNIGRSGKVDNKLYVISSSSPYNTSYAGSTYSGQLASCRYSVFTCSLLKYLGFDVENIGENSRKRHKTLTLYGMYSGALKNIPNRYRVSRSYNAENPQTTQRVLDLIIM